MRQVGNYPLWIGTAHDARDNKAVHAAGIHAIVDLAAEELPANPTRDLVYLRFPIVDGGGNEPKMLRILMAAVTALMARLMALPQAPTVLLVTHDPHVAEHVDRVIELRDGRIVSDRRQPHARPPALLRSTTPVSSKAMTWRKACVTSPVSRPVPANKPPRECTFTETIMPCRPCSWPAASIGPISIPPFAIS